MSGEQCKSYRNRGGVDCVMFGDIEEQPCWGLVRFSKHGCYLCEGHSSPPDYRVEPIPLSNEVLRAMIAEREATSAREAAEREAGYQAGRWFRPLLEAGFDEVCAGIFWPDLSDVLLSFLHSMIGAGVTVWPGDQSERVNRDLMVLGSRVTAELVRRGLPWPEEPYALRLARGSLSGGKEYHEPFRERELEMPLHLLTVWEVQLLYGCACIVADFSSLERGVRQCVMHVYWVTGEYLRAQGAEATFLSGL